LKFGTQARAEWRVLFSAALIGSGLGLGLGAAYMAGGMAKAAADHGRHERITEAAESGGYPQDAAIGALAFAPRMRLRATPDRSRGDLDCLTQAVYFEARGETPRGQAAVAQVVLNRVRDPAFPKTVCQVVFQRAAGGCQFSFACDGSMRRGRELAAWDRARRIAGRALSGAVLAEVGSATHFHTTGVSPGWGPRMFRVAQVGLHVFYRINPNAPVMRAQASERAVFTSLPADEAGELPTIRLSMALVDKATAEAAVNASLATPSPSPPPLTPAKPPLPATKPPPAEPAPPAGLSKTSDTAAKPSPVADSAAS
jgi:hypothetical protein